MPVPLTAVWLISVRKNFAFVFCGRKAFGGNIIKPGYLIRFVPFPFCYTPKQLQPAEGRF